MENGPRHEISNLEISPGELCFDATVDGTTHGVWFRTETEVEAYPEAALAAALMPAMRSGGTLTMSDPISPRVLRNQREFQGIQRAWSREWSFDEPPLRTVEVDAPLRSAERRPPTGRVAVFFSGGVDSWATILGEEDVTDLIFVRGLDILSRFAHQEGLADRVEARLREAADELGLRLHVVDTNVRELSELNGPEQPLVRWEAYYPCTLAAVALLLGPLFDRVLISTGLAYEDQEQIGASWMVDQLWGNENLEIVDAGGLLGRAERVEAIASYPVVQKSLRVCWHNPDGAYNCGRCRKCLVTMATLEAIGRLDEFETFPHELDAEHLELLAAQEVQEPLHLSLCEEALAAMRRSDKPELERAFVRLVTRGRRTLGLPPDYTSRHDPPLPGAAPESGTRLLTTPETAQAMAEATAVAFLVGSYDGSGNFGDIAQLDGALRMLGRLDGGPLILPVLERQYAATHQALRGDLLHAPEHALYFDDGGGNFGDNLVPVTPMAPRFALSYLYGGGFLNPSWGERKLAMLRAVEGAVEGAGAVTRIASGQQVDAGWISQLGPADTALLASFELLGARDDVSAQVLQQLVGPDSATNTGDDAVGVLPEVVGEGEGSKGREALEVNVHIAEHPWVTERPESVRDFNVGLLAELSQLTGRPLHVRPLLAYLDPRVEERSGLERFAAACAERGINVGEPLVLRPANIVEAAADLSGAALTVSCSYHVALTSLLLAVPTVILRDNPYYDQKAKGLLRDFALPDALSPSSDGDPERCAASIAALLEEDGAEIRLRLRERASAVRRRRVDAEADLLARVARGSIAAGGSPAPAAPPQSQDSTAPLRPLAPQPTAAPNLPRHEIANLTGGSGELSFEARLSGREPQRLWIRTSSDVEPSADAALALCLLPAMRAGGALTMDEPVSPRMLRNQREFQAIQRAWSFDWNFGDPPLQEVEVVAPVRAPDSSPPSGRVAAFFSGGVDSFATILDNPEITDLIFVRGIDLLPRLIHQEGLADRVEERLQAAAAELGMPLHVCETNARELSDPLVPWEAYSPSPLVAVSLFLAPLFERVLIAGDNDYETQPPIGSARLVDQLWSTEGLEIVDAGGRFNREQRLARIASHPVVRRTLRVCWENPDGAYNCGRCRKCMMTKLSLEAIGAREQVTTFAPELDLDLLKGYELSQPIQIVLWEDLLDTVRDRGRDDLAGAIEPLVARGREALGLTPAQRLRRSRGGTGFGGPTLELEETKRQLATVLDSRSWKLMAPARRLGGRLRARLRR
ncbi:MAG TPA: polysaccharide pyruvyl transferase family protein [Solirubrobacterales bacterium]|nr:polysaccharide pyruvyl transferase family protein [Solirubrobacterales bacterium]